MQLPAAFHLEIMRLTITFLIFPSYEIRKPLPFFAFPQMYKVKNKQLIKVIFLF